MSGRFVNDHDIECSFPGWIGPVVQEPFRMGLEELQDIEQFVIIQQEEMVNRLRTDLENGNRDNKYGYLRTQETFTLLYN